MKGLQRKIVDWFAGKAACLRRGPAASLNEPRSIILLKLDAIGDFVLSTAFLKPFSRKFKDLPITLVVRTLNEALARQQFPEWNIVALPPRKGVFHAACLERKVRARLARLPKADLMIDLRANRDYADAVVASWVPARCKVATENAYPPHLREYTFSREDLIYDLVLPRLPSFPGESDDLANLRSLGAKLLGGEFGEKPAFPRLEIPASDAAAVARTLHNRWDIGSSEPLVVVCPGASVPMREYPTALLSEALRDGLGNHPWRLVIAGSAADGRSAQPLIAALSDYAHLADATGLFSLPEHCALLARAKLVVSTESSHVHIAGALGTPCICLIGGGHFGQFGPWGESTQFRWLRHRMECFGCQWACIYDRPLCIHGIEPRMVGATIREMLLAHKP